MTAADRSSPSLLDAQALARRVSARRRSHGLSQRQAAAEIGISASTLSRIENGRHLPDREPLLRIARWLDVPVEFTAAAAGRKDDSPRPGPSTVEAVELLVRADPDISAADAEALTESFRVFYRHLRTRNS